MTPPSTALQSGGAIPMPTESPTDPDEVTINDIPRRLMRVKVLYTFDDQNKSNCLARLPNALKVPTVSLDESTQVGVIELKTCIQAIVSASPELVAKLGHDYTVYAFDYSEYETPLVGQGMLSWILASASPTPKAPAEQSQTMVTGRVCNNILGLFSNGIKETLEVKLKLVPVPTCMQSEYVENMERYHNLSKMMPEGMDYNAWAEFLKANPAVKQLAQPPVEDFSFFTNNRPVMGGIDPFHQMLSRPVSSEEPMQMDSYFQHHGSQHNTFQGRPLSPALSSISMQQYHFPQDSRPASRASFRSESAVQPLHYGSEGPDQQEEGPAKKRARVTRAKRPKKSALGANADSLRVTASTAASVRLHKPVATNPAMALASIEQIPRAPTPRPHDLSRTQLHGPMRPPAPSLLRHTSMDQGRRYVSPYESASFSDNAMDEGDDERGDSPAETSMDIPSSPPVMSPRIASSAPSSPGLPTLPLPVDSGFVSDMALGREEDDAGAPTKLWVGSDLPPPAEIRVRPRMDRSNYPWTEVTPGPVELLPKSYVPKLKTYPRPRQTQPLVESVPQNVGATQSAVVASQDNNVEPTQDMANSGRLEELHRDVTEQGNRGSTASPPSDSNTHSQSAAISHLQLYSTSADSPDLAVQVDSFASSNVQQAFSRSTTPNPGPNPVKSKARGLPRSHTWSGEPMSDATIPGEAGPRQPRSGSGAKRKQNIKNRLAAALDAGEMPTFCQNCGEIETPTWRKAYSRIEMGSPHGIELSSEGTAIAAYDLVEPTEGVDGGPSYRIIKQALEKDEEASGTYTTITLCNPCGLWLKKKRSMRPPTVWAKDKSAPSGIVEKPKRKRNPPKGPRKRTKISDDDKSDAVVPYSDVANDTAANDLAPFEASLDGSIDTEAYQAVRARSASFRTTSGGLQVHDTVAHAALRRAIQSSPAGLRGYTKPANNLESDLTPRPTRRLLFPSPRGSGQTKSLDDIRLPQSPTSAPKAADEAVRLPGQFAEEIDKENCPPAGTNDDDDLADLFEDDGSPKVTPTKGPMLQDVLKTPTPGSRRRVPLTPKRGAEGTVLTTPTRNILTPRNSVRAATATPETPFTRQLNALLSDCNPSSPSQTIDFSAFPAFNTPGRNMDFSGKIDALPDDFLSSDMPVPSSPPGGLGFSLYEDPDTSTAGLWSGASIFEDSDMVLGGATEEVGEENGQGGGVLKMGGMSVEFAAMIDEVVGSAGVDGNVNENENTSKSVDGQEGVRHE
ncbi:hypothetical protein BDV95DRAFT_612635 [Massariosphaeria phaeospora]|uniref:Ams2/SPT21 N-terminal domain-containing protein n=1 Tax=Massariosphaeria phaeospora TaxID=100035 RepID=A0A7C8HYU9_9PLEO|nr:hypothetical protein BDV95DRAFT_612635 [Massariosphaeria phaeospora]